jgi:hypothetical protein
MLVVRHTGMIDFPAIYSLVTISDEVLGQGYDIRIKFSKVGRILDHSDSIGPGAGHQAGSGRATNGLLTIGPIETQSISSKRIEYRRLGNGRTITSKLRPQVVDRNEQDIWSRNRKDGLALKSISADKAREHCGQLHMKID